jgi:hypothetical protein
MQPRPVSAPRNGIPGEILIRRPRALSTGLASLTALRNVLKYTTMSNTEELSKTEAAATLGLSVASLDRRIRSGLIPAYRKAGSRRVVLLSPDIEKACAAVPLVPGCLSQRASTEAALSGGRDAQRHPCSPAGSERESK